MLELTTSAVTQTVETIVDVVLGLIRFVLGIYHDGRGASCCDD